jgi:hypothetical protein
LTREAAPAARRLLPGRWARVLDWASRPAVGRGRNRKKELVEAAGISSVSR